MRPGVDAAATKPHGGFATWIAAILLSIVSTPLIQMIACEISECEQVSVTLSSPTTAVSVGEAVSVTDDTIECNV